MNAGRVVVRVTGGLVALGVALLVLIPLAGIVAAVALGAACLVGVAALASVGIPTVIVVVLALVAIGALFGLLGAGIGLGVFALKIFLFVMLLSWLARKVFGWPKPRSRGVELVGRPVADIAAPVGRKDKYDIAAERELDEELGL